MSQVFFAHPRYTKYITRYNLRRCQFRLFERFFKALKKFLRFCSPFLRFFELKPIFLRFFGNFTILRFFKVRSQPCAKERPAFRVHITRGKHRVQNCVSRGRCRLRKTVNIFSAYNNRVT